MPIEETKWSKTWEAIRPTKEQVDGAGLEYGPCVYWRGCCDSTAPAPHASNCAAWIPAELTPERQLDLERSASRVRTGVLDRYYALLRRAQPVLADLASKHAEVATLCDDIRAALATK